MVAGINNMAPNDILEFGEDNGLTFPLLRDTQGVYNDYYIPGGQSPYPRDIIIDQNGIIQYANNEYDGATMELVVQALLANSCGSGDVNGDDFIDILDIIMAVSHILGDLELSGDEFCDADMDANGLLDILDVIAMVDLILTGQPIQN